MGLRGVGYNSGYMVALTFFATRFNVTPYAARNPVQKKPARADRSGAICKDGLSEITGKELKSWVGIAKQLATKDR